MRCIKLSSKASYFRSSNVESSEFLWRIIKFGGRSSRWRQKGTFPRSLRLVLVPRGQTSSARGVTSNRFRKSRIDLRGSKFLRSPSQYIDIESCPRHPTKARPASPWHKYLGGPALSAVERTELESVREKEEWEGGEIPVIVSWPWATLKRRICRFDRHPRETLPFVYF